MPVRSIPLSHSSVTGRLASRPNQPALAFESSLERDFAILHLFDPTVESVEEQPVRIDYTAPTGRKTHYTPDFLVVYRPGGRSARLVEVKYQAELDRKALRYAARFEAARQYATARGWTFEVVTETAIRTPRLENARFLLQYRHRPADPGRCRRLLDALNAVTTTAAGDLLRSAFTTLSEQQLGLPCLWHLVATGRITADLDYPLTMNTMLQTA